MGDCIFCKIRDGSVPSQQVYEDEHCLAFHDLNPCAPVHVLIIPKVHIATLNDLDQSHAGLVSALYQAVGTVAKKMGVDQTGYRLVANCNTDGGQEVFHIHFHLIGGRLLSWPPG